VYLDDLKLNNNKRIIIEGNEIVNPIKVFNWIKSYNELIGNCIRFEISQSSQNIMIKYLFFDNFSYENYIIVEIIRQC